MSKMNELFDNLPESKSPRLRWMEKHGVTVSELPDDDGEYCAQAKNKRGVTISAYGHDQQSAIAYLATRFGWKLWNEE